MKVFFRSSIVVISILLYIGMFISCNSAQNEKNKSKSKIKIQVVAGVDEDIDPALIQKGQVLISYSDCSECHKKESRAKGPSFSDISEKYPNNSDYLNILAGKVISGGNGVWGNSVMPSHPKLSVEDAKAMVAYILSN